LNGNINLKKLKSFLAAQRTKMMRRSLTCATKATTLFSTIAHKSWAQKKFVRPATFVALMAVVGFATTAESNCLSQQSKDQKELELELQIYLLEVKDLEDDLMTEEIENREEQCRITIEIETLFVEKEKKYKEHRSEVDQLKRKNSQNMDDLKAEKRRRRMEHMLYL
jgi:hypothetical protein